MEFLSCSNCSEMKTAVLLLDHLMDSDGREMIFLIVNSCRLVELIPLMWSRHAYLVIFFFQFDLFAAS